MPAFAEVWTYDVPGGKEYASPDYEVTVTLGGEARRSFVHYSHGLKEYTRYKLDLQPAKTATFNYRVVEGNVGATDKFTINGGSGIRARRIGSVR